jgi:hypothetical protein
MNKKSQLTAERLREVLFYEPTTGLFTWRCDRRRVKAGSVAGCLEKERGYIFIVVDGACHRAHRLAFLYMTGGYPDEVDHADRNRANNVWRNLRAATRSQNRANAARHRNNTTGYKGVTRVKRCPLRPFLAYIGVNGKKIELGNYATAEEAHQAYCRAAKEGFVEFAYGGAVTAAK